MFDIFKKKKEPAYYTSFYYTHAKYPYQEVYGSYPYLRKTEYTHVRYPNSLKISERLSGKISFWCKADKWSVRNFGSRLIEDVTTHIYYLSATQQPAGYSGRPIFDPHSVGSTPIDSKRYAYYLYTAARDIMSFKTVKLLDLSTVNLYGGFAPFLSMILNTKLSRRYSLELSISSHFIDIICYPAVLIKFLSYK